MVQPLNGKGLSSSSTFMNSDTGRSTVAYLVRCALPSNRSITKQDQNGTSYTFPGQIGVAPEWETGTCGTDCQQQVTACLLAHVNTSGVHIALWLDGDSTAINWGQNAAYPDEEGSFFGNIFVSPPVAYYCNGKDFDVGVVPGRIGAGQTNAPYKNPFASPGYCRDHCTPADIPHANDGYKACDGYNHIVTVWRNAGTPNGSGGSGAGSRSGSRWRLRIWISFRFGLELRARVLARVRFGLGFSFGLGQRIRFSPLGRGDHATHGRAAGTAAPMYL